MRPRAGFVLLTVLWALVAAAAIALRLATDARVAIGAARNRIALEQAAWEAQACIAWTMSRVAVRLNEATDPSTLTTTWQSVSELVADAPEGCTLAIESTGARLDVIAASESELRALAAMVDAPTTSAAEIFHARPAYPAALQRLPSLEAHPRLATLLDVANGPVDLSAAPAPVIAALPGLSETAALVLIRLRQEGRPIDDVRQLLPLLPAVDIARLEEGFSALQPRVIYRTRTWRVHAKVQRGSPAIERVEEMLITRSDRAVIRQHIEAR